MALINLHGRPKGLNTYLGPIRGSSRYWAVMKNHAGASIILIKDLSKEKRYNLQEIIMYERNWRNANVDVELNDIYLH